MHQLTAGFTELVGRVGLEDMLLEAVFEQFANWWWLIGVVVALTIVRELAIGKRSRRYRRRAPPRRTRRRQRQAASRKSSVLQLRPARRVESATHTVSGKAYVTDGDGVRVDGQEVRLIGLDAPEFDQYAQHQDGYWFNHGKRVKSALIREIGGKHVRVWVEGTDQYGRLLGTVIYKGRDVGEWLVREGHAIAAYRDRYKHIEREAREAKRGMWAHAHNFDPRDHRRRRPGKD